MSFPVEIRFKLAIVLPLVERLRRHVAELLAHDPSDPRRAPRRTPASPAELSALLSIFRPDFSSTGVISVASHKSPAVLRACSLLRLDLRATALAAIPDDVMERGLDSATSPESDPEVVQYYQFLETLQEFLLAKFPRETWHLRLANPSFAALWAWLPRLFTRHPPASSPSATPASHDPRPAWQVVIRNDPVNLMSYVTAVLWEELELSAPAAERHMLEVHQQKSSVVWTGPRAEAETRVRALRSWYLDAELRPAAPP